MPTYCSLIDAYGPNWGKPDNKKNNDIKNADEKRTQEYQKAQKAPEGNIINVNDTSTSVCPNCNQCLHMNNQFQQKVIDTAIRPLPRWVPQTGNLQAFDPFTRYENFGNVSFGKEYFGSNLSTNNAEKLMQLVLYLLIALFIIQLFELIGKLGESN